MSGPYWDTMPSSNVQPSTTLFAGPGGNQYQTRQYWWNEYEGRSMVDPGLVKSMMGIGIGFVGNYELVR